MSRKRRSKAEETARNVFFIVVAILVVVVFFNLDLLHKGDSLFSRTTVADIKFSGDLKRKNYAPEEIDRMQARLGRHGKLVQEITIRTSVQDAYREVTPDTEILFDIRVVLRNGFVFTTPPRRSPRRDLPAGVMIKLEKDLKAYRTIKEQGRDPGTLINTM